MVGNREEEETLLLRFISPRTSFAIVREGEREYFHDMTSYKGKHKYLDQEDHVSKLKIPQKFDDARIINWVLAQNSSYPALKVFLSNTIQPEPALPSKMMSSPPTVSSITPLRRDGVCGHTFLVSERRLEAAAALTINDTDRRTECATTIVPGSWTLNSVNFNL